VVGLKPTRGRTSTFPVYSPQGFSIANMMTRSVRDAAAALDVVAGGPSGELFRLPPPPLAYADAVKVEPGSLHVGVWTRTGSAIDAHDDCVAAVEATARQLESLGHRVEESHPSALDEGLPVEFFVMATTVIAWEVAQVEGQLGVSLGKGDLEPVTWAASQAGRAVDAVTLQRAAEVLDALGVRFASWWDDGFDLLLTPTLAVPPYPLGALTPPSDDAPWPDVNAWIPFTPMFNVSGLPAISLPLHWNDAGLPIGIQLGGAHGREDVVLQVAAQLEAARAEAPRPTVVA
jgi:amidase